MTTALVVASPGLTIDAFSEASGLHPELVKRLVALGALDACRTAAGELRSLLATMTVRRMPIFGRSSPGVRPPSR